MAKAKKIEGLNCEGSAAAEIKRVLQARLEEMCGFRAQALDWSDPEGVHDMRVASRRLRSTLRDFKPYLRARKLAAVADELKQVADALGAVRDEDVAIMALEELQREAPEALAAGVAELVNERRAELAKARAALRRAITEERLAELQAEFRDDVERAIEPRTRRRKKMGSAPELVFREAGREIIVARLAELRELSKSLYRPFSVEALHEMRIAAKRLRYAMELFAVCRGEALNGYAAEVAELQTSLGELHDSDVWLEGFGRMLLEFQKQEERAASNAAAIAAGVQARRAAAVWLMRHFAKARMKHYSNALVRWHEWETNDFFARLVESLDHQDEQPPPAIELSPVTLTASEAVASDIEAQKPS
ncbi:MAG TPA: CHAD domain-containing protein [Pyrinomonadaceae bacterium]|jgi:CHAD domain-containing protein